MLWTLLNGFILDLSPVEVHLHKFIVNIERSPTKDCCGVIDGGNQLQSVAIILGHQGPLPQGQTLMSRNSEGAKFLIPRKKQFLFPGRIPLASKLGPCLIWGDVYWGLSISSVTFLTQCSRNKLKYFNFHFSKLWHLTPLTNRRWSSETFSRDVIFVIGNFL